VNPWIRSGAHTNEVPFTPEVRLGSLSVTVAGHVVQPGTLGSGGIISATGAYYQCSEELSQPEILAVPNCGTGGFWRVYPAAVLVGILGASGLTLIIEGLLLGETRKRSRERTRAKM
jgi:hypothetical protein